MANQLFTRKRVVLTIALVMTMGMLLPTKVNAQSDGFFGDADQKGRDGISLGGCIIENPEQGGFIFSNSQQENNLPLGSGLVIMMVAGGAYVVLRRRQLKKLSALFMAAALMLGLSQCKKNNVEPIASGEGVFITLDGSYNGGKTEFDPSICGFVWSNPTEYINVGGSESGYLGQITGEGDGISQTIKFTGTIATPVSGETLYFMYLGNGDHAGATTLDFSNQDGTRARLTDYHVAVGSAVYEGQTSFTATLEMSVAFARIDMSAFSGETVYVHGDAVYVTASIDYTKGVIYGETKGYINVGAANDDKFVVFIPSTKLTTAVLFDSDSKSGYMAFFNGIQKSRFYANYDGSALSFMDNPQTMTCKGLFTVDGTKVGSNTVIKKMVRFSPGNLQYNENDAAKWRFAEHQWDYVGKWDTSGWVDLFGWGTWSGTKNQWNPLNTSDDYEEYVWHGDATFQYELAGFDDWFTLSIDEVVWLVGHYTSNPGTECREGNRFLNAKIAVGNKRYDGLIIFPDGYDGGIGNYSYNNYDGERTNVSASDWSAMEAAGAVFLPAAGKRAGTSVSGVGYYGSLDYLGYCWTYTPEWDFLACYLDFRADAFVGHSVNPRSSTYRYYGQSVRLVR
jgi:hypothetical protein